MKKQKERKPEITMQLPQNGGKDWFIHIHEFYISVDDNDDFGCTFSADSRETIRKMVPKVMALPNIIVPNLKRVEFHPDLLNLGFKDWNAFDF